MGQQQGSKKWICCLWGKVYSWQLVFNNNDDVTNRLFFAPYHQNFWTLYYSMRSRKYFSSKTTFSSEKTEDGFGADFIMMVFVWELSFWLFFFSKVLSGHVSAFIRPLIGQKSSIDISSCTLRLIRSLKSL